MNNYFKCILALTASVTLAVGCYKDGVAPEVSAGDCVSFTASVPVTELEALQTKGALLFKDESGNVILTASCEESDMPDPYSVNEDTKSTLVTDDNFIEEYGSFRVSGYSAKAQYQDIIGLEVVPDDVTSPTGLWSFKDGTERRWPGGTKLEFFAWAPASLASPTFAPGDGDSATATISSLSISDPEDQSDILLGYYYGTRQSSSSSASSVASLAFTHPLAAVTFKAGDDLTDLVINSIEITGIAKSGKLVTMFGETPAHEWSGTTTGTWKKTFDPAIEPSALETSVDTLLSIPQTFAAGSKLTLNISTGGAQFDVTFLLDALDSDSKPIVNWQAGKITTYTLNYPGTPAISVDDEVIGNVKQNLVIKNTGDCKEWIRATIVGYWCKVDTDNNTSPWMGNGTFVGLAPETSKWRIGEDGYYYYLDPVEPCDPAVPGSGEVPDKLFESFTAPTAPAEDLYLKMFIVSQGVKYDADKAQLKAAWGDKTPITK